MVDNFGANPAPIFGGLEVLHIFLWSGANILCSEVEHMEVFGQKKMEWRDKMVEGRAAKQALSFIGSNDEVLIA